MTFAGKNVLVAGGTGGLGRVVTLAFLEQGARAFVPYQSEKEFANLESAAGERASRLEGRELDVTNEATVKKLVDEIAGAHGHLDVLVNAVGGYIGGIKAWELDDSEMGRMLMLNLLSGWVLGRAAAQAMMEQGAGAIVNVASKAAVEHSAGVSAYAATKAAAVAMMDSLAEDLRGTGVRVNSVLPSIIDTEANRKAMPSADFAKWPKPEDIARVILFLASEDARVIHGAAIPVYGNN
ncbi:MAG TPA: SDR family NAD(P)-dependent oxidoreductase [Bryobacteraceae bacterium]|nr:SDR family NAD(P)-dependent oxidoreductase [Bryobacteraceae bacterium]